MMIHPGIYAALARERTRTLLADAAAARRSRPLLLADGFAGLSDRSRRMRFLGPKEALSAAELRYFTDVDHRDHEALGALDHARGGGVGIARYVRDRDNPHTAEIAVTVIDDWQGRGLGTGVVCTLTYTDVQLQDDDDDRHRGTGGSSRGP